MSFTWSFFLGAFTPGLQGFRKEFSRAIGATEYDRNQSYEDLNIVKKIINKLVTTN